MSKFSMRPRAGDVWETDDGYGRSQRMTVARIGLHLYRDGKGKVRKHVSVFWAGPVDGPFAGIEFMWRAKRVMKTGTLISRL